MSKRGRPIRLVNAFAEFWPIRKINALPDMRGIYILYDRNYVPLYCGRSGKGVSNVQNRIYQEKAWKHYGRKIKYFSVFDLDRGYHHQIETLILHALGHTLRWNKRKGRFPRGAEEITPP